VRVTLPPLGMVVLVHMANEDGDDDGVPEFEIEDHRTAVVT
jgi:hypothetical protein